MDEKIKTEWFDMIIDEENDLTTIELYSLINPSSKIEYFGLVDTIVKRHSIKEGEMPEEGTPIFTQAYRRKFKDTAIKYFMEIEKDKAKDNNAYIPTYPIQTYPVFPTEPNTTPWNPGVFYCTTTSAINQ